MGIYNCAPTLAESIESLLNQTYQDFEIILCDDGSKDNTLEVAQHYAAKYNNILLIRNDRNRGLNYTLNHCLQHARGEYIARMDGDDISLPSRFEKQLQVFEANPDISIVSSAMIYFDEAGDYGQCKVTERPTRINFVNGTPICHAPCMVKETAYDDINGYTEEKKLLRVEDYHLWFKMYAKGYKAYNIQEPLYKMRDDRNAYSRRKYKYRVNEFYVKLIGYRMLNLPAYYYVYALKPLIVGMLPAPIYQQLHKSKLKTVPKGNS